MTVPSNRLPNHHGLQNSTSPVTGKRSIPYLPLPATEQYSIYFHLLPRHLTPGLGFHSLRHDVLQLLTIVRLLPTPTTIPRDKLKERVNKKAMEPDFGIV